MLKHCDHNMRGTCVVCVVLGCLLIAARANGSTSNNDLLESHIHRSHTTDQGQKVLILDTLLNQYTLGALQTLLLYNSPWQIHNDKEFPSFVKQTPPSKGEVELDLSDPECSSEVIPWSVQIPSAVFTKFNIWTRLKECLKYATGVDDYYPYEITGAMLHRGTALNAATCGMGKDADDNNRQGYIVRLFLTSDWLQNDYQYGDLTLFRTNDDDDADPSGGSQVLMNVQPKYGRIAVWDASIPYLSHPPLTTGDVDKSLFITIRCTRDLEKAIEVQTKIEAKLIEWDSSQFFRFPKLKTKVEQNWSKKITQKFQDKDGRSVAIFDKLFSTEDVDNLKLYVSHQGPNFMWQVLDNVASEETTGTYAKWSKIFEPEDFVYSDWWKVIAEVAKSASHGNWYPYDVSFYVGAPTDHTRIHQDCDPWEDDFIFVMYLNSDEMADMYGETTFFDQLPKATDDILTVVGDHNPIGVVKPLYGKAVMYKGGIPYSTVQSSSEHQGSIMPLSFVVKMAATRKQAIAKRITKILKNFPGDLTELEADLLQELSTSARKKQPLDKSQKWLMEELNRQVVKMDEYTEMLAKKARGRLLAK